jgi:hypothetical protein
VLIACRNDEAADVLHQKLKDLLPKDRHRLLAKNHGLSEGDLETFNSRDVSLIDRGVEQTIGTSGEEGAAASLFKSLLLQRSGFPSTPCASMSGSTGRMKSWNFSTNSAE